MTPPPGPVPSGSTGRARFAALGALGRSLVVIASAYGRGNSTSGLVEWVEVACSECGTTTNILKHTRQFECHHCKRRTCS